MSGFIDRSMLSPRGAGWRVAGAPTEGQVAMRIAGEGSSARYGPQAVGREIRVLLRTERTGAATVDLGGMYATSESIQFDAEAGQTYEMTVVPQSTGVIEIRANVAGQEAQTDIIVGSMSPGATATFASRPSPGSSESQPSDLNNRPMHEGTLTRHEAARASGPTDDADEGDKSAHDLATTNPGLVLSDNSLGMAFAPAIREEFDKSLVELARNRDRLQVGGETVDLAAIRRSESIGGPGDVSDEAGVESTPAASSGGESNGGESDSGNPLLMLGALAAVGYITTR